MAWLNGWTYRKAITITEQSGSDLTDYQVKIELNSSNFDFSKANADGSDIRFAADDGTTLLPYWIEEWDSVNQTAKIWVKIPSLLANSSITIYMYYGNPSAVSESDGNAVFEFFDDFEGTSLDTSKWQVVSGSSYYVQNSELHVTNWDTHIASIQAFSVPAVFETKMRTISINKQLGLQLGDNQNHNMIKMYFLVTGAEDVYIDVNGDGTYDVVEDIFVDSAGDTYDKVSITVTGTQIVLDFIRNMLRTTKTYSYGWTANTYIGLGGFMAGMPSATGNEIAVDWVGVRKYAAQEPTFTVSAEEALIISGIVKLSDGTPVSGATVICIREDTYTIAGVTTSQTDGSYAVSAAGGVKNTVIVIPSDGTQNGDIKCHIVP